MCEFVAFNAEFFFFIKMSKNWGSIFREVIWWKRENFFELRQMASVVQNDKDTDNRGQVWILDQKLDQPMEEEAKRLRNMYKEKV